MEYNGGSLASDHLCVLVHGLWGNPEHMKSIAKALRDKYSEDQLYLLVAKRNSGSFTYDGIELGGERVCHEIEEELELIRSKGGNIKKLSIVGYSLGGLVARYAVGLLEMRGVLDRVEPVNFTTFVSPHLGVRTPLRGWHSQAWNVMAARTLSMSGRQLFLIDDYRDTGRPLLSVLTDPESIFMSGLKKFARRTLYTNAVNDRSAVYYTTCIAKTDPYADRGRIQAHYLEGYEDVILDPLNPVSLAAPKRERRTLAGAASHGLRQAPTMVALAVFIPIGVTAFLLTSVVQTFRSLQRIRLHESGLAGIRVENYRSPIWTKDIRGTVEDVYENLNSSQGPSYLPPAGDGSPLDETGDETESDPIALKRRQSHPQFPTLALAPAQFAMIDELDKVGWRKYPVWIHKVRHSHAAIIVRSDTSRFSEGFVVLRHFVDKEFLI
ncbi:DUF676-domain-containing protein [Durotheca rogersii]|uniref:DUF676-domain-containing protein n=1 Tax=Durotheca rogersii TaxID=419775 RepID=UPI00221FBEB7|nr:DUF676-domain-containing protein [Durotheca rogersii]KAI5860171.1 DUF676-domain-containing protein [Durotheca rogersii]